jgi:hypothetical protein
MHSTTGNDIKESIMSTVAAPEKPPSKATDDSIRWLEADKGYALGIEAGKLVCRNPAGKKLASVPKELKESALGEQLLALCEWLAEHRNDCLRRVEPEKGVRNRFKVRKVLKRFLTPFSSPAACMA